MIGPTRLEVILSGLAVPRSLCGGQQSKQCARGWTVESECFEAVERGGVRNEQMLRRMSRVRGGLQEGSDFDLFLTSNREVLTKSGANLSYSIGQHQIFRSVRTTMIFLLEYK